MPEPNVFYGPFPNDQLYETGTGQKLYHVHKVDEDCIHYGCVIHQPSQHRMRDWPTHWRDDRELMERICPHGIGHPDPDQINYIRRQRRQATAGAMGIHGCDGCCTGNGPSSAGNGPSSAEVDMNP